MLRGSVFAPWATVVPKELRKPRRLCRKYEYTGNLYRAKMLGRVWEKMHKIDKYLWVVVIAVLMTLTAAMSGLSLTAQAVEPQQDLPQVAESAVKSAPDVSVIAGTPTDFPVKGLKRFVVGAPNLLAAEKLDSGLRVTGKQPGTTMVALWSDSGYSTYQVRVAGKNEVALATSDKPAPGSASVNMTLPPGGSEIIKGKGITRAAVSDPAIADIVPVSTTEVLVNAKKDGTATIRVWDNNGMTTYTLTVTKPALTPEELTVEIAQQIGSAGVTVRVTGDSIILSGTAPTAAAAQQAASIAGTFGKKVLNLITSDAITSQKLIESLQAAMPNDGLTYTELPDQTVMINGTVPSVEAATKVQDVIKAWIGNTESTGEKSRSTSTSFGPQQLEQAPDSLDKNFVIAKETDPKEVLVRDEYSFTRRVFGGRIPNGPRIVAVLEINPATAKQILVSAQVLEIDRGKLKQLGIEWSTLIAGIATPLTRIIEDRTSLIPLDDAGPFRRTPLDATVRALIQDNTARVLSEPKLLLVDGHAGNILVGGEFPIPVAESVSGGISTITIVFKTFGISLAVRPKVTQDGRVLMTLTPEVSTLDFENGIRTSNVVIPGITTRRSTSTVHVGNKETLAIGGLLSSRDVKTIDRVPLLSKIPIIGELFKSKRFEREETELLILVTPQIVENGVQPSIPTPK